MARFYHIDRAGQLKRGNVIKLTLCDNLNPKDLQYHVELLFPEGVSKHGDTYSKKQVITQKNDGSLNADINSIIELLFEYVRRSNYSHRPSRFQSFFAFESQDEATDFRKNFCDSKGDLWEVECNDVQAFKADMSNLNFDDSLSTISYRASCYWEGRRNPDTSKTPIWEVLLTPPVSAVKKINSTTIKRPTYFE